MLILDPIPRPICIYHSFICKTWEAGDSLASPESIPRVPKTYITLECCHIFSHFYQFFNKECSYVRYWKLESYPVILLQRPTSGWRPGCHSFAGKIWSLGRGRQYPRGLANCAEAWGSPPGRWVAWKETAEGQRARQRGWSLQAAEDIRRRSEPGEFPQIGGVASSLSKMSPTQSRRILVWQRTEWLCQSRGPPGSKEHPSGVVTNLVRLVRYSEVSLLNGDVLELNKWKSPENRKFQINVY